MGFRIEVHEEIDDVDGTEETCTLSLYLLDSIQKNN